MLNMSHIYKEMHGSDEGFKPKYDKAKNGPSHEIWMSSDLSEISLHLSDTADFRRIL